MSELGLQRRERIERVLMRRRGKLAHQRARTATRKHENLFVVVTLGFSFLILGIILLIHAEWQPGNQDEIAREYRATRHEATTVAVNGSKD